MSCFARTPPSPRWPRYSDWRWASISIRFALYVVCRWIETLKQRLPAICKTKPPRNWKATGVFQRCFESLCTHDRFVGHLVGFLGPVGAQVTVRGDILGPRQVPVDAPRLAEFAAVGYLREESLEVGALVEPVELGAAACRRTGLRTSLRTSLSSTSTRSSTKESRVDKCETGS